MGPCTGREGFQATLGSGKAPGGRNVNRAVWKHLTEKHLGAWTGKHLGSRERGSWTTRQMVLREPECAGLALCRQPPEFKEGSGSRPAEEVGVEGEESLLEKG